MKNGAKCGKLYNIQQCSGPCSQTDPNLPDHYAEWKNGGGGEEEEEGGDVPTGDNYIRDWSDWQKC